MQLLQVHPLETDVIDSGLDRLNIAALRKRFLQINRDRMLRIRSAMHFRQEVFLDALPLLFHCNHPMLPGFVAHSTPAGVSGFKPGKRDLAAGKSLARSFCLAGGHLGEDIWGIYLMGSVGTLAHSSKSDFDIWLCHRPGLSQAALKELNQKCERISRWAQDLRLEVHFFLMDCNAFRDGVPLSLDDESSGTAQRALLLDEFYRTAVYITGRLPLWWFVPAGDESKYRQFADELVNKRFVRPNTVLDFGGMSEIPAGEFLGAGSWQLYKAIASPYKSVLKLLLMEAYVRDYPDIWPLALDFKQQVYAGALSIDSLDPYVLSYRRIERHLMRQGDAERLELARRCLYFKINKPLSRAPSRRGKSWQRLLLEQLTQEWHWSEEHIALLDERANWKCLQVKQERAQLVQALNQSYRSLLEFAQKSGAAQAIASAELNVLGRKLQAAFERRPDKLDWINPGISRDLSESILTLVETQVGQVTTWQLYGNETGADTPLRQSDSLVDLLLWAHINGVADDQVQFDVRSAHSTSLTQVRRTLAYLKQWLPLPMRPNTHNQFECTAVPLRVLILINTGYRDALDPHNTGVYRLADQSDPLCYGGDSEILVQCVDLVVLNSWQELSTQRFTGDSALLEALKTYLNFCMPGSHQAPPELDISSMAPTHATLITQRVRRWFNDIAACYYSGTKPPASRYLFKLGRRFYSLQFKGPRLMVTGHDSEAAVVHYLGESQARYSPILVDGQTFATHALSLIARRSTARAVQVFFKRQRERSDIYIIDERGSLAHFSPEPAAMLYTLQSLHKFLNACLRRIATQSVGPVSSDFGLHPVKIFEIGEDQQRKQALIARTLTSALEQRNWLELKAIVRCDEQGHFQYNFHCLGQNFDWQSLGQDVFYTTAQFILQQRQSRQFYPVYITDLDLELPQDPDEAASELQTSHYLRVKFELERKLTQAIRSIV